MPEIRATKKFLKVIDVKDKDIIKFVNAGEYVTSSVYKYPDGNPKIQLQIGVELANGEQRTLTMNKTSQLKLAEVWGGATEDWVGKLACINLALTGMGKQMMILTAVE